MNLTRYRELFVHRSDVFAEQQSSGAYYPVERELTDFELEEHLAGFSSYGVYVIEPTDNTVRYLVFDLDTHDKDAQDHLRFCVETLVRGSAGGTDCLLYETSGNKGTHVWLFFDRPLPARQVRAWVAGNDFMPGWNAVAQPNRWPLEVFPKQDSVEPGRGFGNLVKLPLGVHAVSGGRSEFLSPQGWATGVDDVVPLDSSLVPEAAPPSAPQRRGGGVRTGQVTQPGDVTTPFPCVDRILNEGVPSGYRDNALFHAALYCAGHGFTQDQAEETLLAANEKFEPPCPERDVLAKSRAAFTGRYESASCGSGWLMELCPGPCRGGWHVRQANAGTLARSSPGDVVDVEVAEVVTDGGVRRVRVKHPDAENTPALVVRRR